MFLVEKPESSDHRFDASDPVFGPVVYVNELPPIGFQTNND